MKNIKRISVVVVSLAMLFGLGFLVVNRNNSNTNPVNQPNASTERSLFENNHLAMPLPRMASDVKVGTPVNGRIPVTFNVDYAVSNTETKQGVRKDKAVVTTKVAKSILSTGPNPNNVFKKSINDHSFYKHDQVNKYRVFLPKSATKHLTKMGLNSSNSAKKKAALQLINVDVQQYRDFKNVDGRYDWIEGTAFNAAEHPTKTSDSPGSAVTISNQTGAGIYQFATPGEVSSNGFNGGTLEPQYATYQNVGPSTGVEIALAGSAVSCLYSSNDGSNPSGFNIPVYPGASITQKIVAQDTSASPASSSDAAESANAVEYSLKGTIAAIGIAVSQAFGGPFTLPVSLAANFLNLGSSCNNQPNVFQIGAVTPDGQGSSSVNWAIWDGCNGTCGGLANVYTSPWSSSDPSVSNVVNNAVQLSPDPTYTYQGQPLWLAQQPVSGCGVGDASNSNTSGCTSQNVINLYWTTQPPCPWTTGMNVNGGMQGGNQWCTMSAPSSPEIDYCGTGNEDCTSYYCDKTTCTGTSN